MTNEFNHLKKRTQLFAVEVIMLTRFMKSSSESDVIKKQVICSASSAGANDRSACCARSNADFISKITIVEAEADETLYWPEMIDMPGLLKEEKLSEVKKEAAERTAIFTASGNTAKRNKTE